MEAVPKLPMISFELKVSSETTHFGPKLKQYIAEAYREDPDSYGNEIHQLEGLRSTAVRPSIDSAGLSTLSRYFCQLRSMQSRFPMAKGQPAACSFAWRDLYANMSCSLPDIRFEMACILYNIGALHSQLAASEPRTSVDSMKAACTHFQNAAWAFMYLREQYTQPPGVDVSVEIMRLLQEICFAQAQECILEKSIQDTRKASVIGAVATQVQNFYKNSLALLGPSAGTDNIHEIIGTKLYNYWHRYLSFKLSYIGCIVCLYQGLHAEEQQKMGERVAFYQLAVDKLGEARKLAKYIEPVQITQEALTFTNDVVEGKRKAAKNENEFIYHEEVPDKDLLTDLKPVCLVKAIPINFNDPEVSGPDIFGKLVPMGAHEASSVYSEEKADMLRHVLSEAEAKNTELTEFMSSLQLDQLDVIDSDQKIPQEIVDRCAAMNAKTEVIQTLVDSMNSLAEIISDVEHSLAEIKNFIQEETVKEKEFQKVMGHRPPSIVQTELSREYHKYQEAHSRTNESNQVLHKAMTLHIANLRLLAQPLEVLQSKIPSIDNIEGLDRDIMMEMRRVVGRAREMQAQRDALIQQLREDVANDDITPQLLARSNEPKEDIFKEELEKYTPKVKIIGQNLTAQENIINRLTQLYASYGDSRRMLSDVLRKREGLVNALITSYDTYEELLGKCQKGLEFYKKLSMNVNQLLSRLRSTCQVQEEERAQQLAKQSSKGAAAANTSEHTPVAATPMKLPDTMPVPSTAGGSLKLKDYLPYMKNAGMARGVIPPAPVEHMPESYYPESIYPTSVRPAPVGSEATDISQMKLPDGVVTPAMQGQNPYNRYGGHYPASETDAYPLSSNYQYQPSKPYKPDDAFGYSTSYTPQFSSQSVDPQYSNPYYSGTQNNTTAVSDSQNPHYNNMGASNLNPNPYINPDSYMQGHQMGTISEVSSGTAYNMGQQMNQSELNVNFGQMQIAAKPEPGVSYNTDYSQTFYCVQYPATSTPVPTYSYAPQNSNTSTVPANVSSDTSATYPYSAESAIQNQYVPPGPAAHVAYSAANQPGVSHVPYANDQPTVSNVNPVSHAYSMQDTAYSFPGATYEAGSQGYTIYTNTESVITSTTSVNNAPHVSANIPQPYSFEQDPNYNPAALAQLDAMDQPIKSHVTGEALSSNIPSYQSYDQNAMNIAKPQENTSGYNPSDANYQQPNQMPNQNFQTNFALIDQTSMANYSQSYQNHPGYTYNAASGAYEYNYGSSQNSYNNFGNSQTSMDSQKMGQDQNWAHQGVYTSAGHCETLQSPSENTLMPQSSSEQSNNQVYYNSPYGYQTATNQSSDMAPNPASTATNYGADMNQSTYMQSGQQNTSVTFSNNQNQVTTPIENEVEPKFGQNSGYTHPNAGDINSQTVPVVSQVETQPQEPEIVAPPESVEVKSEPSAFDLLSDIDFTVEQPPLMPEIKVPQISESLIKKPVVAPKMEPVVKPVPKEETIERPAKRDVFSDPSLLNKFTEEVKNLQKLVDSLVNKTVGGITVLDAKWKTFQDTQTKENMSRSKSIAQRHSNRNIVTDVVPYDDSRLTLKSNPDAYINASYYKQLASWCIPLVISKNPSDNEYSTFWKAILENKISCVVCLLSEIEMQGKSYWPTAKGQSLDLSGGLKVTLDEVTCTVHWTERKLTVTNGKTTQNVSHYQINVFPAKIVCSPLVLLADKILSLTYDNRLSNQLSGAWVQCAAGSGRSAVMALLIMVMCQVRAGQLDLTDMLDVGCINLCKNRTNVLEDTKYVADAYRTALFYVQGVLCSGTTMFNGEAVSGQSGASILPPAPPATSSTNPKTQKFSRESFEEMKQAPGLKSGDMKDPLNFLDPLWSLKKK
ncbi:tyrosine-protein phosphatase non-receptor type 23 [Pectinophora gossypiella]|uniref:tyrosine-protein phosphatase non-receptor type 23 n=1 Tax=Pectinophora gossypiella TaxID=13191 RepID=UPI00214E0F4C|nr:tyrosine-protein phosphatase non-receptor type 23 [Pectinophora gossypiella]